ncbi:MAG: hypothetical protein IPI43_23355 [Sandaracinaceae bacterium]|nr:hypothetical protein [Sandaracinaceae bacterium]
MSPVGMVMGRAWIEWRAYQETLRAYADVYGPRAAADPTLHAYILLQFTGPAYLFMWPFPRMLQRLIDAEVQAIEARHAAPARDTVGPWGIPSAWGAFYLQDQIGQGGMGAVWRGVHLQRG